MGAATAVEDPPDTAACAGAAALVATGAAVALAAVATSSPAPASTAISVPTVVGRRGALAHVEVELWPKELQALQASARALNETFAKVKAG